MNDLTFVLLAVSLHLFLCAGLIALAPRHHRPFNHAHFIWILLIPIFGPLAGLSLIRAVGRKPPDADWLLQQQEERHRINIVARSNVESTVPLEEALLINDPHKRRNLMMNILRSDPMRYLDLLLIARYNDDTETAHYATASIMEIQRQFQLDLQQYQLELTKQDASFDTHRQYIELLSRYCLSGLLEGQLLRRQQLLLKTALDEALKLEDDPDLLRIKVGNSLALKDAQEARKTALHLIDEFPRDERSWLEGMRVYTETRDPQGMRALLKRIEDEKIDLTAAGREHLHFLEEVRT